MNLNKATLVGRVTKDPESRALPGGGAVVNFGVATNRTWKGKDDQKQEETEFHNIVAFGKLAEIIARYVKKGQLILIEGRIQTRSWEAEGIKKYRTEIVAEEMQMGPRAANSGGQATSGEESQEVAEELNPEDVPF